MTDALLQRIVTDPQVCGGQPRIRGTRIRVSPILDVPAAIAYGAEAARVRFVPVPAE